MHEIAEYGIAAHALYKDGAGSPTEMLSRESSAYAWLRRTIELLAEGSNPEEFLEHTKLELFHDQVFCFTPKGKLIALPRQANADRLRLCGAHRRRQHGGRLPRSTARSRRWCRSCTNGDEVEIITSKAQTAPPAAWESLVVTGKARAAIRRATRVAVRAQYAGLGRRIVERLCQRAKSDYSDEKLQGALPRLARASIDEVFVGGRPRRDARRRRRARDVSRLQGGARRRRSRSSRSPRAAGSASSAPRRSSSRCPAAEQRRRRSRSAASTATCRCASRPTAARCRATASSAS